MIRVIYDGFCPECSLYVRHTRLTDLDPDTQLIDAREAPSEVRRLQALGVSLDDGMVLEIDGTLYHGAKALHHLALLTTRSGLFNRVNRWCFGSDRRASLLYPGLRSGRNVLLKMLGHQRID